MRNHLVLTTAIALLGSAALGGATASAQTAPIPAVTVSLGPTLQAKADDYGCRELGDISHDLQESVQRAVDHSKAVRPVRVDLVIEDAVPNRPTFAQLGRTIGLSERSVGLGGARISGVATYADGARRPIREQFFETDLRDDRGVTPWFDADRAFDQVAYDIGRGKFPDRYEGPGPSGSGHFGEPFTDR